MLEGLVDAERGVGLGIVRQPGVEQHRLHRAEAHALPLGGPQPGDGGEFLDPLLGEHAEAAVAQGDEAGPLADRREHLRQRHGAPLEIRLAVEIEPVDAGGDRHLEAAGRAVELPLRLHGPPLGEEGGDRLGDLAGGDLERRRARVGVRIGPEAELPQVGGALALRLRIAEEEPALRRLIETPLRRAGGHLAPLIEEEELRARRAAGPRRGEQAHQRPGGRTGLLDAHRGGEVERRQVGAGQQVAEQLVALAGGDAQGLGGIEQRHPPRSGVRERCQPIPGEEEPGRAEHDGWGSGLQALLAPNQSRGEPDAAIRLLADLQPDLPRRAAVPDDGRADPRLLVRAGPEAVRGAELGDDDPGRGGRQLADRGELGIAREGPPLGSGVAHGEAEQGEEGAVRLREAGEGVAVEAQGGDRLPGAVVFLGFLGFLGLPPPAGHHAHRELLALEGLREIEEIEDLAALRRRIGGLGGGGAHRELIEGVPPGRHGGRPQALLGAAGGEEPAGEIAVEAAQRLAVVRGEHRRPDVLARLAALEEGAGAEDPQAGVLAAQGDQVLVILRPGHHRLHQLRLGDEELDLPRLEVGPSALADPPVDEVREQGGQSHQDSLAVWRGGGEAVGATLWVLWGSASAPGIEIPGYPRPPLPGALSPGWDVRR